jgi:uncharacterized protein YndB with AHSA1/START domain
MTAPHETGAGATIDRPSDREVVVTRTIKGPARVVFTAWTQAELFRQWWVPRSFPVTLLSCEIDARVGGRYRLEFGAEGSSAEFFGRYLEVTPPSRLVWTNEEGGGETITTATFEDVAGGTRVVVHDLYPSKEACEEGSGSSEAMPEVLDQLEQLVASLDWGDTGS